MEFKVWSQLTSHIYKRTEELPITAPAQNAGFCVQKTVL